MVTRGLTVVLGLLALVFLISFIFNHINAWIAVIVLIFIVYLIAKNLDSKFKS